MHMFIYYYISVTFMTNINCFILYMGYFMLNEYLLLLLFNIFGIRLIFLFLSNIQRLCIVCWGFVLSVGACMVCWCTSGCHGGRLGLPGPIQYIFHKNGRRPLSTAPGPCTGPAPPPALTWEKVWDAEIHITRRG